MHLVSKSTKPISQMKNLTNLKRDNLNQTYSKLDKMLIICLFATLLASNAVPQALLAPIITTTTNNDNSNSNSNNNNKYQELFINSQHANDLHLAEPQKSYRQVANSRQKPAPSRTVINGNHATYVEPPADFKPIIYEPENKQQTSNQNDLQSKLFEVPGAVVQPLPLASETLESPNQLVSSFILFPMTTDGLSKQQYQYQLNQQQTLQTIDQVSSSASADRDRPPRVLQQQPNKSTNYDSLNGNVSELSDKIVIKIDGEQNSNGTSSVQLPMKEPVDRWSDWHDMSIEPDLASSNTGLPSSASSLYAVSVGRRRDEPSNGSQLHIPIRSPCRTRYGSNKSAGRHQQQQQQQQSTTLTASQLAAAGGTSEWRRQNGPVDSYDDSVDCGVIKPAALNFVPSQRGNLKSADNLIKMQQPLQPSSTNQQPPSHATASSSSDIGSSGAEPMQRRSQFEQQSKTLSRHEWAVNQQQRRRPKWRRKLKTNAEVRIQQLMAPSQQAQQQHPSIIATDKQVNVLGGGSSGASFSLPLIGGGVQQQQLAQTLATRRQAPGRPIDGHHHQLDERVFSPGRNRPALIVRRFGPSSLAPETNSTSTNVVKRAIRRRPLRTLLPVGLSSWFLGGIRDLDGRHWRLPAEVVSKLAINDIDLHHEISPNSVPTAPGSVSRKPATSSPGIVGR